MRRKSGSIIPLEARILGAAVEMAKSGEQQFHGFELAKELQVGDASRKLTAHGTLYKALTRMEKAGLLQSVWEDPAIAADEGRPRRRLYSITTEGRVALVQVEADAAQLANLDPGWSPT